MYEDKTATMDRLPLRVAIAGVGGGACYVLDRMQTDWEDRPRLIAVNTDSSALGLSQVETRIQIGAEVTKGFGTGGKPELGAQAIAADRGVLDDLLADVDLLFLVTCLGGGTGTGAAPGLASLARARGATVVAFATLPFDFEGSRRGEQARRGLADLQRAADLVLVLPNQRLFDGIEHQSNMLAAFAVVDERLGACINTIWRLLSRRGAINMDIADLREVFARTGGFCSFSGGEGRGKYKGHEAVTNALSAPVLRHEGLIGRARALVVCVLGGPDLSLQELDDMMTAIGSAVDGSAHVAMGAVLDPDMEGRVAVTIVAAEDWRPESARGAAEGRRPGADGDDLEADDDPDGDGAAGADDGPREIQIRLPLESLGKGRFKDVEPTIYGGQDLDIPTFIRRGVPLEK